MNSSLDFSYLCIFISDFKGLEAHPYIEFLVKEIEAKTIFVAQARVYNHWG